MLFFWKFCGHDRSLWTKKEKKKNNNKQQEQQ